MKSGKTMLKYTSIINSDKMKTNYYKIKKIGFLLVILIQLLIFIYFYKFTKILLTRISDINNNKIDKNENIENRLKLEDENFNEYVSQKYISNQNYFCQNDIIFNNTLIEDKIRIVKANINNINFDMYVYKTNGCVSKSIMDQGFYEFKETNSILSSLKYYSNKHNIDNNKIYIIDVGANIGWYTFLLGKEGYNILSFEPSKINYFILLKTYCLNKNINVTIINKGLDNVEKTLLLYHPLNDIGNGVAFDGKNLLNFTNHFKEEISTTKLVYYIDYLKSKHLALIKIDVEGSEGNVLKGGIDLIIKYHVPFIFMEWNPNYLKLKGTEPNLLLDILENNGYKISIVDFLSRKYISKKKLLKFGTANIYIVYEKFLQ